MVHSGVWCDLFSWDIWTDSEDIESYTPLLGFMTEDFNRDLAVCSSTIFFLMMIESKHHAKEIQDLGSPYKQVPLELKKPPCYPDFWKRHQQEPAIKTSPILISGVYNQALPPDFVGALSLRGEILEEPPYLPPSAGVSQQSPSHCPEGTFESIHILGLNSHYHSNLSVLWRDSLESVIFPLRSKNSTTTFNLLLESSRRNI
ncbi:predicted protein [Botrytis cinerea T4]|uniref:Uncharacterized protein n=1 Tax=Botryotinia fuckeliana (strain T4) TaxID=999810 RepID=G2XRN2_BOTF4|nr:predicted protein [Botrytis cinerea T4]